MFPDDTLASPPLLGHPEGTPNKSITQNLKERGHEFLAPLSSWETYISCSLLPPLAWSKNHEFSGPFFLTSAQESHQWHCTTIHTLCSVATKSYKLQWPPQVVALQYSSVPLMQGSSWELSQKLSQQGVYLLLTLHCSQRWQDQATM